MKLASASLFAAAVVALAGCPGDEPTGGTTPGGGSGSNGAGGKIVAGDVQFDIPAIEVKGITFEPDAISRPGMPTTEPKGKPTLDKMRKTYAGAKDPVIKQAYAAQLATLLYLEFKKAMTAAATDKAKQAAARDQWLTEARQVLRDAAANAGEGKADELTLRMLGTYELLFDDYAGSEKAWSAMVNKEPNGKEAPYQRAWWALSLLWQNKNAEALAVVKDQKIDDKQPELAYAAAWARWRTGDEAGAWAALMASAANKNWTDTPDTELFKNDGLLFAGRTTVPFATAYDQLQNVFGKSKAAQYSLLVKLGLQAYGFAGRWQEGINAIEKAFEVGGDTVPADDKVVLRFTQADYTVRLDTPDIAAKYGKQAIDAIAACGAKCSDQQKADYVRGVYGMGRLFHLLYATANDFRYYQPAHDMYEITVPIITDPAARADAAKDQQSLETTLKNTKVGTGRHEPQAIGVLLSRHNQEIQACYEATLATNVKTGGQLIVNLESDQSGAIKGVATEPKAGLADMSAVAGCVVERAKQWKLPKRGMPGGTRIKLTYQMSIRKP